MTRSPHPADADVERQSHQPLAEIQHSRADNERLEPTPEPDQAALVADPRNRLVDGTVDPETEERKPAGRD